MKKNKNLIKVAFTGGGTGGHIYPGLAIADELVELCKNLKTKEDGDGAKKIEIFWIGSSSGMDKSIVEKSSSISKFYGIPSGKLRRYFSLKNFTDVFKIICGCVSAFFILLKNRPVVVFSKGGFVSVPPCFAAKILHIPVITHECDFTPGLATKINSRFATKILLSYEETKKFIFDSVKEKTVVTGNPVRPIFYSTDKNIGKNFVNFENSLLENINSSSENLSTQNEKSLTKNSQKPVLLVMGGSLGAKQINDLVTENLKWICERFNVIHQTGNKNLVENIPESVKNSYKPFPFIYQEMPHVIDFADVVLSRAGANSLWECAVLQKPLILIPLCGNGTRGDQVDNAEFFEKKGAAVVLKGVDATSESLKNALTLMQDSSTREKYSVACKNLLPQERSALKIARIINDDFILNN